MQLTKSKYIKKDPISHCLSRPDMYIGSINIRPLTEYVSSLGGYNITQENIQSSAGILRIFIEILSNAIDNVERSRHTSTPCKKIKVTIDEKTGETSVWNDGDVVPIEMNLEERCYNHTMIFGQLLTGSNYDDEEERIVAGRNGIGAKACSIFSLKFTVEGCDPKNKKILRQTWTNNMRNVSEPVVTKAPTGTKGYTHVTWTPDFIRFGMKGYTSDIVRLYTRYVIDAAMIAKVDVYLNDALIPVKTLAQYAQLYQNPMDNPLDNPTECPTEVEKLLIKTKTCEVMITLSNPSNRQFEAISFVNGIYTRLGGQHVEAWSEAIFRPIVDKFNGKDKKAKSKTPKINISDVKQFFRIFVVATVVRPEFNGQNKEKLESPNVEAEVKKSHINMICKWSVMDNIEDIIKAKEMIVLKKVEKKQKHVKIEGMDPANNAGGKFASDCSLFICEGLSAKTYVVAGIDTGVYGKQGRNWFGILPVTGKLLNVRNATPTTIAANKIVVSFIQTLGLHHDLDYNVEKNYKTLNYGRVILITDADCFTGDTPIIVKRNSMVDIVSIKALYDRGVSFDDLIWSDEGWTKIMGIKQKTTTKNIIEICTKSDIITCTEDHECLLEDGTSIRAKDIIPGHKLLRTHNSYSTDTVSLLDMEEAHIWGLFFAKGLCNIDREQRIYYWNMSNTNIQILENVMKTLQKKYDGLNFSIVDLYTNKSMYILTLDGVGGSRQSPDRDFVTAMRARFYEGTSKKVPQEILNAPVDIQNAFLYGYKKGNLFIKHPREETQLAVQGICYLFERVGKHAYVSVADGGYNIDIHELRHRPLTREDTHEDTHDDSPEVISTRVLTHTESTVYDLETENHHLNAGIGGLVVHNCDGIHIEGLIMNLIHNLFPTLLQRVVPYIVSMKTPIARVFRPRCKDILFYDERRFHAYINDQTHKVNAKYYKGLGTTREEDVPDTFGLKMIEYVNDVDITSNMNKIFHKKYSDARKEWLSEYAPERYLFSLDDQKGVCTMTISDFLNGEMIKFSHADCSRSLPNGIDGMKESQRKILYAVRKRNLKFSGSSLKVAQLSGYTAEHSNYHHGEQNLQDTIVNMASGYPGTNNIPLLYPDGGFGTRSEGGKDAANARYIYTKMEGMTEYIFRSEDDALLTPVNDDGDLVQPEHYIPIIPMILVNGCSAGIGTGWSCNIPCYNPKDLVKSIKVWLDNDGEVFLEDPDTNDICCILPELTPWYRDFKGEITGDNKNRFTTNGIVRKGTKKNQYEVIELPIGMWTNKFKEYCEDLVDDKKINAMSNHSTIREVNFLLTEASEGIDCSIEGLKLQTYLYTSNMVLFDEKTHLKKYDTVYEIIDNFCKVRFEYYRLRKIHQIKAMEEELKYMSNRERFIREVIDESLSIMNRKEADIIAELKKREYDTNDGEYDYLLRMQVRTFTSDKVEHINAEIATTQKKLHTLRTTNEKQVWLGELTEFEKHYDKWLLDMQNRVTKKTKKK